MYSVDVIRQSKRVRRRTNDTRTEVEVLADDLNELLIRELASAVGIDVDREGLSDTDGVRKLDERTARETSSDERLGCGSMSNTCYLRY